MLFPDGEASSAVIWEIGMRSETAADRLAAAAGELAAVFAGVEEAVAAGQVAETPEGRFVCVSRPARDRVRFLNAASRATAERLR